MSTFDSKLKSGPPVKPMVGKVFGRLSVLEEAGRDNHRNAVWKCQCVCGTVKTFSGALLRGGKSTSCGCYFRETHAPTHGGTKLPEYRIWHGMWDRCTNPKATAFSSYQQRCPPEVWRDFAVFYAELGPRPTPKHTLERIKNDLPYGPGNCKWATRKEQSQNISTNRKVLFEGVLLSLSEACRRAGLNFSTISVRLHRGEGMTTATNNLLQEQPHG